MGASSVDLQDLLGFGLSRLDHSVSALGRALFGNLVIRHRGGASCFGVTVEFWGCEKVKSKDERRGLQEENPNRTGDGK
jgi:hypothetical protein